jgi:hypothetical protein
MDKRHEVNPFPLVYNHFENTRGITTKTGIVRSLRAYYEDHPECGNHSSLIDSKNWVHCV